MTRRAPRRNRTRDAEVTYGFPVDPRSRMAREHKRTHWGVEAQQRIRWNDNDLPDELVQMGKLVELRLAPTTKGPYTTALKARHIGRSHLVYDAQHKSQRLYVLIPKGDRRRLALLFKKHADQAVALSSVARDVGGRHSRGGYPSVKVVPLGFFSHVTYQTKKRGDDVELVRGRAVGPGSKYIHEMGECGGIRPKLCVDAQGRLWVAGGSYRVQTHGIVY